MNSEDVFDSNHTGNEGKAESEGNKPKEKKYRNIPPTKVVIRRLPPSMTLEKFIDQVSPLPENDYLHFAKADASLGQHAFCTAYVNFVQPKDVFIFKEKFDDYIFIDSKGNEFPAVVEFAPFQKIPRKKSRQRDPKCGTIDTDPDYLTFVTQVKQAQEEAAEGGVKSTCGKSSPLLSVQDVLEEIEAKERERKTRKATTPLIEFIKLRKLEKQRMKDEKKEERKRREVERKRAKEEERKHRREANREAIQNKRERERKEQRKEGAVRHDDRLKHDVGHGTKIHSESQLHSGGDGVKQKKDYDNHYDDPEEDEDDEGIDDEDDDVEPDIYDQEQTQKLKEILRIGVVCKGAEKNTQHESTPDVAEAVIPKKGGTEKGTVSGGKGGGDWERGNRSQRATGSYNEDYQGARPKVNRSEMGCQERRGPAKDKKQNDPRQYIERHNQKPGKVWLAKNESRNQKFCDERIKIQKADSDKGGLANESQSEKNLSRAKGEDAPEAEARPASSASEDPIQSSSQVTTPSSEIEDPGCEGGLTEEKGGMEQDQSEKAVADPESRHGTRERNMSGSKGSRDSASGSSGSHNSSNGEVRRMRNKVGTSRDSNSQKMIKNKDRPSIEIYRPGMRRFNLQKKDPDPGSNTKGQGSSSSISNSDSTSDVNSTCSSASGYSSIHNNQGNVKGKERDDKRRIGGGRGGGNKRREGSWKQGDESGNIRHDVRHKGRDDRGRGGWVGQGEGLKTSSEGSARERYDEKLTKEDQVEVRSMTFKRSVSRD